MKRVKNNFIGVMLIDSVLLFISAILLLVGIIGGVVALYGFIAAMTASTDDPGKGVVLFFDLIGGIAVFGILACAAVVTIYSVLILVLSLRAKKSYAPSGKGLKKYRKLMGGVYALLGVLDVGMGFTFLRCLINILQDSAEWQLWIRTIVAFIAVLMITGVLIYNMINTYSKRITEV